MTMDGTIINDLDGTLPDGSCTPEKLCFGIGFCKPLALSDCSIYIKIFC